MLRIASSRAAEPSSSVVAMSASHRRVDIRVRHRADGPVVPSVGAKSGPPALSPVPVRSHPRDMTTVIVPLDVSVDGEAALPYVRDLAVMGSHARKGMARVALG